MRQFSLSWWHTAHEPEQFPSTKLRAINFTYHRLKIQLWNPGILCRSSQSKPTTAWSTPKTLFYKSTSPSQPIIYNDSLVTARCQSFYITALKGLKDLRDRGQTGLLGKGTSPTNRWTRGLDSEDLDEDLYYHFYGLLGGGRPQRNGWALTPQAWRTPGEKAAQRAEDSHGQWRNFPTIKHTNRAAQGSRGDPCPWRRWREGGKEQEELTVRITEEEHAMLYLFVLYVLCREKLFRNEYWDQTWTWRSSRNVWLLS